MENLLLPTVHNLLDTWRRSTTARQDHNPNDQIACTSCVDIGLKHPMKFKRSFLEAHVQEWQRQEIIRRGSGMESHLEEEIPCDYCGKTCVASNLLSAGVAVDFIPCPSCLSNNLHPPFSFNRQDCVLKLLGAQGYNSSMRCVKEETDIRTLDLAIPNCFASYQNGEYTPSLMRKLAENLHHHDKDVLFWPENLDGLRTIDALHAARHAIRKSSVTVVFLSDEYFVSTNCIREFNTIVEEGKGIIALIIEPFSYFRGRCVPSKQEGLQQWYPNDSSSTEAGLMTYWSILQFSHPIDYRTEGARVANEQLILREISEIFLSGEDSLKLQYTRWRSELPEHSRKALTCAGVRNTEAYLKGIYAELDVDGSGSLDSSELTLALSMLGLKTDGATQLPTLMQEVSMISLPKPFHCWKQLSWKR